MERILCAAIHIDDGNYHIHHEQYGTGVLYCGHRHHNIIAIPNKIKGKETQGFLTDKNRFVDRKEAAKIAFEANQVNDRVVWGSDFLDTRKLDSNDLY